VNHLDRQRAATVEQLRSARSRTQQLGEFGLRMSELFESVVQQIDRIGNINVRPAGLFVFFNECRKDIELVALLGPGGSTPSFSISRIAAA
jgi:hypothetical protein